MLYQLSYELATGKAFAGESSNIGAFRLWLNLARAL